MTALILQLDITQIRQAHQTSSIIDAHKVSSANKEQQIIFIGKLAPIGSVHLALSGELKRPLKSRIVANALQVITVQSRVWNH